MNKKERITWIFITIILVSITIFQLFRTNSYEEKLTNHEYFQRRLKNDINQLKSALEKNESKPELLKGSDLSKISIRYLKQQGLQDPEYDIKMDLLKHLEFIPFEPVLGGIMGYLEESIRIIHNKVLVGFEDGHIGGVMLLKYHVASKGVITWKVLYSKLSTGLEL